MVYGALVKLYQQYHSLDLILLHDSLTEPARQEAGGAAYIGSLVSGLPENGNFDALLSILIDAQKRRGYEKMAERLMSALSSGEDTRILESICLPQSVDDKYDATTIQEAVEGAARSLDEIRKGGVDLHFGVTQLDDALGGIRRKKLYTLGGRTSQGKTTVCANIIQDNLKQNKACRIYYNGFENVDEMPVRLASIHSGTKLEHFVKPHLTTDDQHLEMLSSLCELSEYSDRLIIAFGDSVKTMRQVCKTYKPDIVFVDYIQRLAHKYDLGSDDRLSHAIGKAVSDLQDIAIDFNCAMFCCSQFRRTAYEGRGKEPGIEDLKESGDIENESDNIILLWWPWRETLDDKRFIQNEYRFLIRKNKLGPCLDVKCKINLETLKVSDW